MFEILFVKRGTDEVIHAINEVRMITYVTQSEVGFISSDSRHRSASFTQTEDLEIRRAPR